MSDVLKQYREVVSLSKEIQLMTSIDSLLEWDKETYMPEQGIRIRSLQKEYLAKILYEKKTSKGFQEALSKLIDLESGKVLTDALDPAKVAALQRWRRDFIQDSKLDRDFVSELARITSEAAHAWQQAKRQNAYSIFLPHLEKIIEKNCILAEKLGYDQHPYDALIDIYEPEMTTAEVKSLFEQLKPFLIELIAISNKHDFSEKGFIHGDFARELQLDFGKKLINDMGLADDFCRIDRSTHPFCLSLHPKDVRITSHAHCKNMMSNIFTHLHEGGHALYEANLSEEHFGTPLAQSVSSGIHESQSRFWEAIIGHSQPFWEFYFPKLQSLFPDQLASVSLQSFYQTIHRVKPSLIRVHADEVTYCLHIILRFEMELDLISGKLKAKDVPEVWNHKMQQIFGIAPSSDAEGCLQDIHWAIGAFGYFPTYALGNIYSGQLFQALKKDHPDWSQQIGNGNLTFLKTWLCENIYRHGRRYSAKELIQKVSGKELSTIDYMSYLSEKYRKIYR